MATVITNIGSSSPEEEEEIETSFSIKDKNGKEVKPNGKESKYQQQIITDELKSYEERKTFQMMLIEKLGEKGNVTVAMDYHENISSKYPKHTHYKIYSDYKLHRSTLYKALRDFQDKEIEVKEMQIIDNSSKTSFLLKEDLIKSLSKINENNFSFLKRDSKGNIEVLEGYKKEGSKNPTGLGKFDRPYHVLNGTTNEKSKFIARYSLDFSLNGDIQTAMVKDMQEQVQDALIDTVKEQTGLQAIDTDVLNMNIKLKDDKTVSISFNNLFKNGDNIVSVAKNQMEIMIEKATHSILQNYDVILENNRFQSENALNAIKRDKVERAERQEVETKTAAASVEVKSRYEAMLQNPDLSDFEKSTLKNIIYKEEMREREAILEAQILDKTNKINEINDTLDKTKSELETTQEKLESTEGKLRDTEQSLSDKEFELEGVQTQLNETENKLKDTEQSLSDTTVKLKSVEDSLQNIKGVLKTSQKETEEAQSKAKEYLELYKNSQSELEKSKRKINSIEKEMSNKSLTIVSLNNDLDCKDKEIDELNKERKEIEARYEEILKKNVNPLEENNPEQEEKTVEERGHKTVLKKEQKKDNNEFEWYIDDNGIQRQRRKK